MKLNKLGRVLTLSAMAMLGQQAFGQSSEAVVRQYKVTLKKAHVGNLEIDTLLLNSYGDVAENVKRFYLDGREHFSINGQHFSDAAIVASAQRNGIALMGGPMLGDLQSDGVSIWLRPANSKELRIEVSSPEVKGVHTFVLKPETAGKEEKVHVNGLTPNSEYQYKVMNDRGVLAAGQFRTAPKHDDNNEVRVAFGSCFHKIGLHNPNLINTILERAPQVMMILGDIAVDDREDNMSMHRSDYLLRDVSPAWQQLAANMPLYTNWDDHDYLNNDLSGVPERFEESDRENLRAVWEENWNNPQNERPGIYFNTRIGQVELIMLDTRSCRNVAERHQLHSYLGEEQMNWLKEVLENSTATYKVISSGTMWSDDMTKAKDSWGTWDTEGREQLFSFIEEKNIGGVLLISGDRHGARGMKIRRDSGFDFHEFEAATLGGVNGPPAMAEDPSNQIFGYKGEDLIAFGEFSFKTKGLKPQVTFRLINQTGEIMEEHVLDYETLQPRKEKKWWSGLMP